MSVTRISTSRPGSPRPVKNQALHLAAASEKWEGHADEFASLPWSQCPPEMVADFVRAVARDLEEMYADQAPAKAWELLAATHAPSLSAGPCQWLAAWSASPARLSLSFRLEPADLSPAAPPSTDFEVTVPEGTDDEGVRQALSDWVRAPRTSLSFDPIERMPGSDLKRLLAQVEDSLARQGEKADELGALASAASVLLAWKHLESSNAASATMSLGGVSVAGVEACPGYDVVIEAKRTPLEPPAPDSFEPLARAHVAWKPS